jgi:hypothetical protein
MTTRLCQKAEMHTKDSTGYNFFCQTILQTRVEGGKKCASLPVENIYSPKRQTLAYFYKMQQMSS